MTIMYVLVYLRVYIPAASEFSSNVCDDDCQIRIIAEELNSAA